MNERPPAYPSIADLARELSMSETTISERVKQGLLPPPIRIGASVRWDWNDVVTAINSLKPNKAADMSASSDPYIRGAKNAANH